jgi:hypothetical protein
MVSVPDVGPTLKANNRLVFLKPDALAGKSDVTFRKG